MTCGKQQYNKTHVITIRITFPQYFRTKLFLILPAVPCLCGSLLATAVPCYAFVRDRRSYTYKLPSSCGHLTGGAIHISFHRPAGTNLRYGTRKTDGPRYHTSCDILAGIRKHHRRSYVIVRNVSATDTCGIIAGTRTKLRNHAVRLFLDDFCVRQLLIDLCDIFC